MPKSPNPDIIDKIYFRNIYSCQRKIYWYKVKVMETINAVWEHSYGEDCIPNFSANMEQPRHRWYEFKEGFSLTLVERAIRETKKDNKSTSFTVLDPFSGSGTSPLTALQSRCNAIGYEVNPFMSFVGKTKCVLKIPHRTQLCLVFFYPFFNIKFILAFSFLPISTAKTDMPVSEVPIPKNGILALARGSHLRRVFPVPRDYR